jgi:hypothetical protein
MGIIVDRGCVDSEKAYSIVEEFVERDAYGVGPLTDGKVGHAPHVGHEGQRSALPSGRGIAGMGGGVAVPSGKVVISSLGSEVSTDGGRGKGDAIAVN